MTNVTVSKQIRPGSRLGAMLLDHIIMVTILMFFSIPGMISGFANTFKITHEQAGPQFMGGPWEYLSMLGIALYLCKDCINGRSIAKRILSLQVVDNLTGQAASPVKCLVRNLFIVLWPIEVLVALANTGRRLGDRVAGTRLVVFETTNERPKVNIGQVLISVVIAYGFVFLLTLPFKGMMAAMEAEKINYVEASYNDRVSKETEKLFADGLGQYLAASIEVYDQVQNKPFKYVSVVFQLRENYFESSQDFEQIKSATMSLLSANFPRGKFVGRIKYVYQTGGSMQIRTMSLD
ncbi:RDD family protein [Chitinophaga sp. GCM10012297]|uniref:RDD family protein n=1 Tax=Chitinophaga chungangae TaxID=2821488 RepID=A0ABS3YAE0_9BACT|nr:RDD family protein [Chitinophaga chungangae]MBO9151601.1 RDD family protein [Chitinophaga chungangae]